MGCGPQSEEWGVLTLHRRKTLSFFFVCGRRVRLRQTVNSGYEEMDLQNGGSGSSK